MRSWTGEGVVHVHTTRNNTILTCTTPEGDVLCWASCGALGFRGAHKSTSYGAQAAGERLAQRALQLGCHRVHAKLKGVGYGREASLAGLVQGGLRVLSVEDRTPVPYNGCRPPKARRL